MNVIGLFFDIGQTSIFAFRNIDQSDKMMTKMTKKFTKALKSAQK